KEVGEGIGGTEHLPHFLFCHRPTTARRGTERYTPAPGLGASRPASAGLLVEPPILPQFVVLLAPGRVAQDFVRLVQLLEPGLGDLVARIDVGMVLPRQLTKGLLDLFVGGRLGDAEGGVVILEVHDYSNPRRRMSWSSSCARRRFSRLDS